LTKRQQAMRAIKKEEGALAAGAAADPPAGGEAADPPAGGAADPPAGGEADPPAGGAALNGAGDPGAAAGAALNGAGDPGAAAGAALDGAADPGAAAGAALDGAAAPAAPAAPQVQRMGRASGGARDSQRTEMEGGQARAPLRSLGDIWAENERLCQQQRALEDQLDRNRAEARAVMEADDEARGFCFRDAPCNLGGKCRRPGCRKYWRGTR
jgi:hypothetical protein